MSSSSNVIVTLLYDDDSTRTYTFENIASADLPNVKSKIQAINANANDTNTPISIKLSFLKTASLLRELKAQKSSRRKRRLFIMAKTITLSIETTDGYGKKRKTNISNVNPNATNDKLLDFSYMLVALMTETYNTTTVYIDLG